MDRFPHDIKVYLQALCLCVVLIDLLGVVIFPHHKWSMLYWNYTGCLSWQRICDQFNPAAPIYKSLSTSPLCRAIIGYIYIWRGYFLCIYTPPCPGLDIVYRFMFKKAPKLLFNFLFLFFFVKNITNKKLVLFVLTDLQKFENSPLNFNQYLW